MFELKLKPLPMKAAEKFWEDKVLLSPGQFRRLSDAAKVKAFGVSGIAKGSELTTVFEALERAISEGISFDEFKKSCGDIFSRRGWTGVGAWRVDNIFRTNIQTAYNAGRYKEMMDVKSMRPYWQYSAVNDSRTRPAHRAVNKKIYRHDHPFWDTWYPPNGFRCRCTVVTLSEREVKRDDLKVETEDITGHLVEPTDPETGNKMPARPLMPDPGFSYHPGKTVYGGMAESAAKPGRWTAMSGLRTPKDYRRKALKNVKPSEIADFDETMLLPAKKTDDFYKAEFIKRYGQEKVIKDAAGEPVVLSLRSFMADKKKGTWKFKKPGHGESIPLLDAMAKQPFEIWLTPQKNESGRVRLSKRYISFWKTSDKKRIGGIAVHEAVNGVFQGVTNFLPVKRNKLPDLKYVERLRQGILLWKKGQ